MHPFMVSYGFEGFDRLHLKQEIPAEVIARTPDELSARVLHALALDPQKLDPQTLDPQEEGLQTVGRQA